MKVSVCMISYNHEQYIAQAIESILMQQTKFDFELVIGEDCSTDNTREICVAYQNNYPDKIRLLLPEKNLGMHKNFFETLQAARGEYIAFCEGDDYWIDPLKLQKQVDFLDANPDCAFCFTNAYKMKHGVIQQETFNHNKKPPAKFDLEYYLKQNFPICHNTKVWRKAATPSTIPDWVYQVIHLDFVVHIFHAQKGLIGYLDEITSVYRIHEQGIISSTKRMTILQKGIYTNRHVSEYLGSKYAPLFNDYTWYFNELSYESLRQKDMFQFLKYFVKSFAHKPFRKAVDYRYYFATLVNIALSRSHG